MAVEPVSWEPSWSRCSASPPSPGARPTPAPSRRPTRPTAPPSTAPSPSPSSGRRRRSRPTSRSSAVYNSLYDGAEMEFESYSSRESLMGTIRESGEVPDVFLASGKDLAWLQEQTLVQPVDSAADRARPRLRRPLLARRGARLQRRQPAAVHAGRHLADGPLLQHRARRLRADGAARPAGARRRAEQLGLRAVHAPPPSSRPSPGAGPAPSTSSRRSRGWRRSCTPGEVTSTTTPSRPRRCPSPPTTAASALEQALTVLRDPRLTLSDVDLREALGAGVVQARQARDDPRLPRAGAAAAAGHRAAVRRDLDAGDRAHGHRRHD